MVSLRRDERRPRVLIVEDEDSIRSGVCDVLAYHGYQPEAAADGESGLRRALDGPLDVVILDIMLPGLSGLDVCRRLRDHRPGLGILMLTAKGSEEDVIVGLKAGADDYITKPFSIRELVARVEALLRRVSSDRAGKTFDFGRWQIDSAGLLATASDGAIATLSQREVDLLSIFERERGRVLSRRKLLRDVWELNNADVIETRTVDVHIAKLRKKLDADGEDSMIETVRGSGYRFRPRTR